MGIFLSQDQVKTIGPFAGILSLICGIIFLVILLVAMWVYPGGYDFFGYYISSLGAVKTVNGEANPFSPILFFLGMSLGAISLFSFWVISHLLLEELPYQKTHTVGSLIGIIATPFMVFIAVFPTDEQKLLHLAVTIIFFTGSGVAILIYSIRIIEKFYQRLKDEIQNYYLFITFLITIFSFLLVLSIISNISSFYIIIIAFIIIISVMSLKERFPTYINLISYLSSVFIILLIVGIPIILIISGISPIIEISFVYGMIIWIITHILRVWPLVS